MNSIIKVRRSL